MTNKEAINIMSQMIKDEEGFLSDDTVEAHKMAIKALEQEPCEESEEVPCDNCKYLDGDGCRLVFEQIEYGKASDECPSDNNVSTKNTVSRETFEQVMWERDIAISQLKELGYGFGEKIEPCGNAIDRAEAIKIASGYCHPANVAKELAKLPSVNPQPCEEAISRQAVLDMATTIQTDDYSGNEIIEVVDVDDVKALPPVTPQPKTGYWIDDNENEIDAQYGRHLYKCSKCNEYADMFVGGTEDWWDIEKPNYCPNCGAKMVEPQGI